MTKIGKGFQGTSTNMPKKLRHPKKSRSRDKVPYKG